MIKLFFMFILSTFLLNPSFASIKKMGGHKVSSKLSNLVPFCETQTFPSRIADNREECDYLQFDVKGKSQLLNKLNYEVTEDGPLTLAEKVAIARYTITYERNDKIIVAGAKKLPSFEGVVYRGEPLTYSAQDVGGVITYEYFRSVSKIQYIAEGFLNIDEPSQLLIIKAKSARSIANYSQGTSDEGVPEDELLLLPGTKLKIDKVYMGTAKFFDEATGTDKEYPFQFVELSEIE